MLRLFDRIRRNSLQQLPRQLSTQRKTPPAYDMNTQPASKTPIKKGNLTTVSNRYGTKQLTFAELAKNYTSKRNTDIEKSRSFGSSPSTT